jgi:hypothetical protein
MRNKKTGAEFHHGGSQTVVAKKVVEGGRHIERFHRDAQTVSVQARSCQGQRESSTQMTKVGVWVDDRAAKVLHPRPYVSAEEVLKARVEAAIKIQCFIRGGFARQKAKEKKAELAVRRAKAEAEAEKERVEAERARRAEVERRMRPKDRADFSILNDELNAWRKSETQRIKQSDLTPTEKNEALALLLNKETKLLQTIDRLKIQANAENRDEKIRKMLELMAAPKKWQLSDGTVSEVETPFTMRAKELMDLYNGLRLPLLSVDERLDVLLHVKWTVKEFDCNLTREIVELIDREADLLNRGRAESSLSGLRKRLANLFLQFVQTPEFNPESVRFEKVPVGLIPGSTAAGNSATPSRTPSVASSTPRPKTITPTGSHIGRKTPLA